MALASTLALLTPAAASASTADVIEPQSPPDYSSSDGWQAGTCESDVPTCSVDTTGQFFEQAAGHPQVGFTQFIVKHTTVGPLQTPVAELKTVRVDLPVGLSVNPGAAPRCPRATFEASPAGCPPGSQVGTSAVTTSLLGIPLPPAPGVTQVPVYNVVPEQGEPARFGLDLAGNEVYLAADVDWAGDYHEGFTIEVPRVADLEPLIEGLILKNRLVFDGRAGDGTFITTPSTCLGPAGSGPGKSGSLYSTWLLAGSYQEAEQPGYDFATDAPPAFESPIPPGTAPKECDTVPYDPELSVAPGTADANSPAAARVEVTVPHLTPNYLTGEDEQANSTTRSASVTLPRGMGINPAAANGLEVCEDSQFGRGTVNPVACPPASRIGTATIVTPPLPEGDLEGPVFVGRQLSRDPLSGDLYRIFIVAESARYGISVRLLGKVRADPATGQLTKTIDDVPQVAFTRFELRFDGGPRAVLGSPPTCGPNRSGASMSPSTGNPPATPTAEFALSGSPLGGECAPTMAARPFAPAFSVAPADNLAGGFSPLAVAITRRDGEQELKGVDVTLPPGVTARLAGVSYCPEAALAAAAANSGAAESAASSCPPSSRVGSAAIAAGTGPQPLRIEGKVFLSGPFDGAPLSLAVVTPATAGPFDLGTVVVRVALFVDPETARIRAYSDSIPDVFGGAQLGLRSVEMRLDRENFSLNPTSCRQLHGEGALLGGGADPTDPAAFGSGPVAIGLQTRECGRLKFRPKIGMRLFGGRKMTKRLRFPKFRAVLQARPGDANIARTAVTLPPALILEQSHLRSLCSRPRLAAGTCPRSSIYGHASARTPLLEKPLRGPVYLVPGSESGLPDLLADLRGQVDIRLRGIIDSTKGRLRTTFKRVPDVPVSKFVLTMKGGKRGLLVNTRDLCKRKLRPAVNIRAHNGKKLKPRTVLRVPGCR